MTDTIAAVATPPGRGGVGIVRVSGRGVPAVAEALLGGLPAPRHAAYRNFRDRAGECLDTGLALFFPAPHSFTGEDVLELHAHGGPVLLDLLLAEVLAAGARAARPGEFTERAFLNNKLDLAQAEAVADLIDSASEQAARSAARSLAGAFSRRVRAVVEAVVELRTWIEAAIDFPEEEVDFLADADLGRRMQAAEEALADVLAAAHQGCLLREGMNVVIAGRPNAGKSSLLNRLAGRDTAIVNELPGTTRDVLREQVQVAGMPVHVIDTAGLREGADAVEREGVRRAWGEMAGADRVLLLVDDREGITPADRAILERLPTGPALTVVRNKVDLSGSAPGSAEEAGVPVLRLSARTGAGVEGLRRHLAESMGLNPAGEGGLMARRRHLDALRRARAHLVAAREQLETAHAGELAAEELRGVQQALGEITGEFTSEDLLGRIFSSFCIGK